MSDEFGAQCDQALRNVLAELNDAGVSRTDVAKLNICTIAGSDVQQGVATAQEIWGPHPAAITVIEVASFGRSGVHVEIDALAHVPGI